MTLSIGVAEAAENDTDETLLKRADAALYRAKAAGRNGVSVADNGVIAWLKSGGKSNSRTASLHAAYPSYYTIFFDFRSPPVL